MDVSGLTMQVVAILAPYAAKGAQEFISAAGQFAYDKATAMLRRLKERFSDDQVASHTLERFEQQPERYQAMMEDVLQQKLGEDEQLAGELQGIVNEIGPKIEVIQKLGDAQDVTGVKARKMTKGQVKVDQQIDRGKNITGAEIDEIG